MVVVEIKHVNRKERTNFNMANRFYNFQFHLVVVFPNYLRAIAYDA